MQKILDDFFSTHKLGDVDIKFFNEIRTCEPNSIQRRDANSYMASLFSPHSGQTVWEKHCLDFGHTHLRNN